METQTPRRRGRRAKWPPPAAISPAGRTSALTFAFCLVVTGAAYAWGAWDELRCAGRPADCEVFVGVGGFVSIAALATAAIGVVVGWSMRGRAVTPTGESGWRWALALLFAVGATVLVSRFPSYTCPPGVRLSGEPFRLCIDLVRGDRYDPAEWIGLKWAIVGAAALIAVVATRLRVPVAVAAPLAAIAWFAGMGWLLVDTVAREFLPS